MIPDIRYDNDNEVLFIKFKEIWTEEDMPDMFSQIRQSLREMKQRNIIADLSLAAPQKYSKEFRKKIAEEAVDLNLDKTAILGANPVLRMMSKVLLAVLGNKWSGETRFFGSKSEAMDWLKGSTK